MENIKGKVFKFGDDINTDEIIPAEYLVTTDAKELGKNCMRGIREEFSQEVEKGDIIVAGENFGCGSSREHAPISIKGCGISCVIAKSFARIFYRNSINIGLPILEYSDTDEISEGDILKVNLDQGVIKNSTTNDEFKVEGFPEFIQKIISSGGLLEWIKVAHSS